MGIRRSLSRTLSVGLGILLLKKLASLDDNYERQLVNIEPIIKEPNNTQNRIEDEDYPISIPYSDTLPAGEVHEEAEEKSVQGFNGHGTSARPKRTSSLRPIPSLANATWRSLNSGGPDFNEIEEVSGWSESSKTTETSSKAGNIRKKATGLGIKTWRSLKHKGPDYNEIEAVSRARQDSITDWRERVKYEAHLAENRKYFAGVPLGQILDTKAERDAREDPLFERLLLEAQEPSSERGFAQIRAFWEDVRSQLSSDDEELVWPEGYPDNREPCPDVIEDYLESRFTIPIDQEFS